jgi:hypothetical protein
LVKSNKTLIQNTPYTLMLVVQTFNLQFWMENHSTVRKLKKFLTHPDILVTLQYINSSRTKFYGLSYETESEKPCRNML